MTLIQILFWCSAGIILYSYLLYPVIIFFLSRMSKRQEISSGGALPNVSVIVAVYNEEKIIRDKLRNIKMIDYPEDKIEYLFGSDGSSDQTVSMLRQSGLSNLKVFDFTVREGKASVLNRLVPEAAGEIVIFSDANTMYDPQAVKKMVRRFSDPSVGGVCGELRLQQNTESVGEIGETSYWRYESVLKKMESGHNTLFGATGGIYAIRKSLFKPLPLAKAVVDDFLIPIEIVRRGYRVVYEEGAIALEKAAGSVTGELARKIRIGASNFNGISEFADLLHPKYGFIAFGLWSHKIIRWFIPFFLLITFLLTVILAFNLDFYFYLLLFELIFLGFGIIGYLFETRKISLGILGFPYYFTAMNLALFIGFLKYLFKRQKATWSINR